jgi:hypothetical protein
MFASAPTASLEIATDAVCGAAGFEATLIDGSALSGGRRVDPLKSLRKSDGIQNARVENGGIK